MMILKRNVFRRLLGLVYISAVQKYDFLINLDVFFCFLGVVDSHFASLISERIKTPESVLIRAFWQPLKLMYSVYFTAFITAAKASG